MRSCQVETWPNQSKLEKTDYTIRKQCGGTKLSESHSPTKSDAGVSVAELKLLEPDPNQPPPPPTSHRPMEPLPAVWSSKTGCSLTAIQTIHCKNRTGTRVYKGCCRAVRGAWPPLLFWASVQFSDDILMILLFDIKDATWHWAIDSCVGSI